MPLLQLVLMFRSATMKRHGDMTSAQRLRPKRNVLDRVATTSEITTPVAASAHLNSTFTFFELPKELRDMVYDEIWKHIPGFTVYHGADLLEVKYQKPSLSDS